MSVQIHINGDNAAEAIKEFAVLASHFVPVPGAPATADQPKADKPARGSRNATKPEPAKDEPEAKQEQSDQDPPADPDTGSGDSDEPIPTDVELRAMASEIGKKGPEAKKAIKALLDQYGVPNITSVPDDQRVAFKAELEELANDGN